MLDRAFSLVDLLVDLRNKSRLVFYVLFLLVLDPLVKVVCNCDDQSCVHIFLLCSKYKNYDRLYIHLHRIVLLRF